jgi:bifunctional DNase/RNase
LNKVQVEILGLSASPSTGGAYALLLKEMYGNRRLPIIIGSFEAQAIAMELEGINPPRPLTHDLLKTFVDNLSAVITEVLIDELRDNTFFAKIVLEVSSLENPIDARPSDAIALAVRTEAPIFVSESVMESAGFVPSSETQSDYQFDDSKDLDLEMPDEEEKPKSKETKLGALKEQLRTAIEKEDYERAAKLRDEISGIEGTTNIN